MVEYKNYNQTYENAVIDLWNECCFFDPIDIVKFRRQAIFDDNFDEELCLVALDGDKLVGFILGTHRKFPYLERGLEPEKGWINVLFVKEGYRRQKIASKLYDEIEAKLVKKGVKDIVVGAYSPSYFFAGIDTNNYESAKCFFESKGYKSGAMHYSMGMDLHGFVLSEYILNKKKQAEEKGYKFVNFNYRYALDLLTFMKDEFGGGWKRNSLLLMRNNTACDCIILVLDKNDKICGAVLRAIDDNPMRFGPVGVAESERNSGIGGILLNLQMYEMTKRGVYRMYFMTTEENGRRYYEKNGLSVIRTSTDYKKEIL